jgi:hypothetical protein
VHLENSKILGNTGDESRSPATANDRAQRERRQRRVRHGSVREWKPPLIGPRERHRARGDRDGRERGHARAGRRRGQRGIGRRAARRSRARCPSRRGATAGRARSSPAPATRSRAARPRETREMACRVEGDEATIKLNQPQDNTGRGRAHGGGHVVSRNVAGGTGVAGSS